MTSGGFGTGSLAIAICDRCGLKYPYMALRADVARPGLRVCKTCVDLNHPIKNFKPRADNFNLQYPRPDELLYVDYVIVKKERGPIQVSQSQAVLGDQGEPIEATGYEEDSPLNQYLPPSIKKKNGIT